MAGTCLNCGKYIPSGSGYYSKKQKSEGRLMATLSVLNNSEDTSPKQGKFCCERCYNEYILTHPEEMSKKEAKASKKEAKKVAAAKKLEDSKVTSDESLEKISHLCLVAGLVGAHRFAVGKFLTGIIMPARILRRQRRLVPGHLAFSWRETHGILASAIINRRLEMR